MTNFLSMKRASVVHGSGVYKGQGACLSLCKEAQQLQFYEEEEHNVCSGLSRTKDLEQKSILLCPAFSWNMLGSAPTSY